MSHHLLNALRDEARGNLRIISAVVVGQVGPSINVGETFTVKFTIANTFEGGEGEHPGHAHFTDVKLQVSRTEYAVPVDGDPVIYTITPHLGYGNSTSQNVTFRATRKLQNIMVPIFNDKGLPIGMRIVDPIETIAHLRLLGKFDIAKFFEIVQLETAEVQVS
jgi:hypothetical protein